MIVPVVSENKWLAVLSDLMPFEPSGRPIVLVSPHPDDETLGAGGLIAAQRLAGVDVTVVAVTDGENAYPDYPGLAECRQVEQERALLRLGVPKEKIVRLRLTDSAVASQRAMLTEALETLVTADTHLIAPWIGDFHPDHEVCGAVAEEVAQRKGARLTSYFFWTWHRGTTDLLSGRDLRAFHLTPDLIAARSEALACHASQLFRDNGEPILPELLLAPAKRSFEVFLIQ